MKLLDLNESKYIADVEKEGYTYSAHYYGYNDILLLDIDVTIRDLDTLTSRFGDILKTILTESLIQIKSEHLQSGQEFVSLNYLMVKDELRGGGSTIVIGSQESTGWGDFIKNNSGRSQVIDIEDPTNDINNILNNIKNINIPTKEECMTKLKRDHLVVKGVTRKYDVKDINIELTLLPKISSVAQLEIEFEFETDDETKGTLIALALKPYSIRPQINSGPILGNKPL